MAKASGRVVVYDFSEATHQGSWQNADGLQTMEISIVFP